MEFDIKKHTILKVVHGSHAYGTNTPESDMDYKGVVIPPKEYFFGFLRKFEQFEIKSPTDEVLYEIRKFCQLAAECNPNIIEVLFVNDSDVVEETKEGLLLRENAEWFISKKAKHTFSGYAVSQLKRIKTHRRWLLDPPKEIPKRSDYGLRDDRKSFNASEMGAMDSLISSGEIFPENVMVELQKEKAYQTAKREFDQYNNWKKERNVKRAALEAKSGYDTKHGMHLVRLLRMCEEILSGKGVIVKRPDAEELLSIRNGAWSFDQIVDFAEKTDARCDELYQKDFGLPKESPRVKIDKLCMDLVELKLKEQK